MSYVKGSPISVLSYGKDNDHGGEKKTENMDQIRIPSSIPNPNG